MRDRKGKRTFITISSSSSSSGAGGEVDSPDDEEESQNSVEEEEDDDDYSCSSNSSEDEGELSDGYVDDSEGVGDDDDDDSEDDRLENSANNDDDEAAVCNRIIRLLLGKRTLQELSLKECKTYLRRHGLRISGTKDVCLSRIQEHWRIKDGNGESLYPRSSFTINCTGDVCRGDIVLFTQKVYQKFDKMTRTGKVLGRRTVVGRVVKESYGAAKQQHTFTVEVLWCRGEKKLPPLFPLLVKGRNLYRMRTFRQPWTNEAERSRILDEKHRRGMVARQVRAMRKERRSTTRGVKRQKKSHPAGPTHQMNYSERSNSMHVEGKGGAPSSKFSSGNHHQKAKQPSARSTTGAKTFKLSQQHQQQHFPMDRDTNHTMLQKVHQFPTPHHRPPFPFSNGTTFASSPPVRIPQEMSYSGPTMIPSTECHGFNQRAYYPPVQMIPTGPTFLQSECYGFDRRAYYPRPQIDPARLTSLPLRGNEYQQRSFYTYNRR